MDMLVTPYDYYNGYYTFGTFSDLNDIAQYIQSEFYIPCYTNNSIVKLFNNTPLLGAIDELDVSDYPYYEYLCTQHEDWMCNVKSAFLFIKDINTMHKRKSNAGSTSVQIFNRDVYDRGHLIAASLGGANKSANIVLMTKHLNRQCMRKCECTVKRFLKHGYSVSYGVHAITYPKEIVCRGVLVQAKFTREQDIYGFCVFMHNTQPGVDIDYMDQKKMVG